MTLCLHTGHCHHPYKYARSHIQMILTTSLGAHQKVMKVVRHTYGLQQRTSLVPIAILGDRLAIKGYILVLSDSMS